VQAAAQTYLRLCAAGDEPLGLFFPMIMASARYHGMLNDPAVLAAARWQEWLHPRGMDGRFIEVKAFVDVFRHGGGTDLLTEPHADRRRARVIGIFPEDIQVQYFDLHGDPLPADPADGYPTRIPQAQIKNKVSSAPNSTARLPWKSSHDEFHAGLPRTTDNGQTVQQPYAEPGSQAEYDARIEKFNNDIYKTMKPNRSAVMHGPPVDNESFSQHLDFVTEVTNTALGKQKDDVGRGLASDAAFKDQYGRWSQPMMARMLTLASEMFDELTTGKPKGRKAILIGGLPGSGKSSLLNRMSKEGTLDQNDWVTADPDIVKTKMIEQDWFPDIAGLSPGDTSGFIHAQSAEISTMLERLLMHEGYNIIFDSTMGNGDHVALNMEYLKAHEYKDVDGIFIQSTANHALASITHRYRAGLDKLRTGVSGRARSGEVDPEIRSGGRFVPTKVVTATIPVDGGVPVNKSNFERVKPQLSRWAIYVENGTPGSKPNPQLDDSSPAGMPGSFDNLTTGTL
jgi:hypothetical protein